MQSNNSFIDLLDVIFLVKFTRNGKTVYKVTNKFVTAQGKVMAFVGGHFALEYSGVSNLIKYCYIEENNEKSGD